MSRPNGSWTLPAPSGAYAGVVAWHSAETWFDAVMDVLATPEGEAARRRAKVARDTLLRVAYADRQTADRRTGRGVATAHETVAEQLGMSAKTVQRSRLLLEALGLAVTVAEGRYLTAAERSQAATRHGGHQVRAASTRALTLPPGYRAPAAAPAGAPAPEVDSRAVESVHLPPARGVKSSSHLLEKSPRRALTRTRRPTATRRASSTTETSRRGERAPRGIEVQRLAAEVMRRMPWLARAGRHIGALCDLLDRHRVVEGGWTAAALLDAIDRHAATNGIRLAAIDDQRDPVGYFAWLLRQAVPAGSSSPATQLLDERRERVLRQARERAAEAAKRARIEAEADAIQSVIDGMRVALSSSRKSSPSANR